MSGEDYLRDFVEKVARESAEKGSIPINPALIMKLHHLMVEAGGVRKLVYHISAGLIIISNLAKSVDDRSDAKDIEKAKAFAFALADLIDRYEEGGKHEMVVVAGCDV